MVELAHVAMGVTIWSSWALERYPGPSGDALVDEAVPLEYGNRQFDPHTC